MKEHADQIGKKILNMKEKKNRTNWIFLKEIEREERRTKLVNQNKIVIGEI